MGARRGAGPARAPTPVDPGSVDVGLLDDGTCPDAAAPEPPTPAALEAHREWLEPSGPPWSVAVPGGDVVTSGPAEPAVRRGGHLRIDLEDFDDGRGTAPSNRELLDGAPRMPDRVGATPAPQRGRPRHSRNSAAHVILSP
ncbi:hypothetical protein WHI96_17135 [Pseudonocardia tropica]|uniref:Uncharacterized protein n=1 Tax=Pseudonocardia tropica TaxID=681289 RepID=A0ABV1JX95_9PSEU